MLDETTDAGSYRGTLCSSSTLGREVREDFVGMYVTAITDAKPIVAIIKDAILRFGLMANATMV